MAEYYYKLSPSQNPDNWTTEVVFERDAEGNVTKSVQAGVPTQLSSEDVEQLKDLGFKVERSSKKEAESVEESTEEVADDPNVAGAAPVFGSKNSGDSPVSNN